MNWRQLSAKAFLCADVHTIAQRCTNFKTWGHKAMSLGMVWTDALLYSVAIEIMLIFISTSIWLFGHLYLSH